MRSPGRPPVVSLRILSIVEVRASHDSCNNPMRTLEDTDPELCIGQPRTRLRQRHGREPDHGGQPAGSVASSSGPTRWGSASDYDLLLVDSRRERQPSLPR